MINYKEKIAQLLSTAVEGLTVEELQNMIEVPADSKMGDYAFPCFKLAKVLRKAPPMIAKGIADQIAEDPMFEKVEQVNAYVNMFVSKTDFAKEVVTEAVAKGVSIEGAEVLEKTLLRKAIQKILGEKAIAIGAIKGKI